MVYRSRACLANQGCEGEDFQQNECNLQSCRKSINCYRLDFLNPFKAKWDSWTHWSVCSEPCGGGSQVRTRECSNRNQCDGRNSQTRDCNNHSCGNFLFNNNPQIHENHVCYILLSNKKQLVNLVYMLKVLWERR